MDCAKMQALLPLWPDELEEAEEEMLSQHLQKCGVCQKVAEKYIQDRRYLQQLSLPQISPALWQNWHQEIFEQIAAERKNRKVLKLLRWGVTASVAATLLFALMLWGTMKSSPQPNNTARTLPTIHPKEELKVVHHNPSQKRELPQISFEWIRNFAPQQPKIRVQLPQKPNFLTTPPETRVRVFLPFSQLRKPSSQKKQTTFVDF